jgi:hypothetical protein
MAFNSSTDNIDWMLLSLPWKQIGDRLVIDGLPRATAKQLVEKPGVYQRIEVLLRQAGLEMAQIMTPGSKNGYRFFAGSSSKEKTMNQLQPLSDTQGKDNFLWLGGRLTEDLKIHLKRMEDSESPMGLLEPRLSGGVIKTIQWGINSASVKLFNYDALSDEDMEAAILRDTTGDWFPEDLERKRHLYQQGGDTFEQVARIKIKTGWMLVRIQSHRIANGNLVMVSGQQESQVVEQPEMLVLA